MLELLIKAIATWRISHMLTTEDGPNDSIITFRHMMRAHYPEWSPLFCLWCTSLWVAPIVAVLPKWCSMPWALSGLAIVIEEALAWLEDIDG